MQGRGTVRIAGRTEARRVRAGVARLAQDLSLTLRMNLGVSDKRKVFIYISYAFRRNDTNRIALDCIKVNCCIVYMFDMCVTFSTIVAEICGVHVS